MITEILRKIIGEERIGRYKQRAEEMKKRPEWLEEYRNPVQYIKENCAYSVDSLYNRSDAPLVSILFGNSKTINGLNALSRKDTRTTEEIRKELVSKKEWDKFKWEHDTTSSQIALNLLPETRGIIQAIEGFSFDNYRSNILTKAVYAIRITSDWNLGGRILNGGIRGKTFVDYDNPLEPYRVDTFSEDDRGFILGIERGGSPSFTYLKNHYSDRELKTNKFYRSKRK